MIQKRNGCFETNSSSSHSVCISMDGRESQDIQDLIHDDTLHIYPRSEEFDGMKTNETLPKLQFLVALVCNDVTTTRGSKKIKQFRTRLKNMLGVGNVYIGHVDEYYRALKERGGRMFEDNYERNRFLKENFKLLPVYDDLGVYEEIFETPETLRSFVLSPGSWLYSTPARPGDDLEYYRFRSEKYCGISDLDVYDSIATVCYGPNLKVDVPVSLFNNYTGYDNYFKYKVRYEAGNITTDDNSGKLVLKSVWDKWVGRVGDKYSLIQIEPREDFYGGDELCDKRDEGYIRFKENKIFTFDGKVPEYAKSVKTWQVDIQSQEFLGTGMSL